MNSLRSRAHLSLALASACKRRRRNCDRIATVTILIEAWKDCPSGAVTLFRSRARSRGDGATSYRESRCWRSAAMSVIAVGDVSGARCGYSLTTASGARILDAVESINGAAFRETTSGRQGRRLTGPSFARCHSVGRSFSNVQTPTRCLKNI